MASANLPILYHYPMSPYSEKVRLALGILGRHWLSVEVPPQPPRPMLRQWIGGYRRIPVLQMGAHFYCDSNLAVSALQGDLAGHLHMPAHLKALCRHAENDIFFSVIASAAQLMVLRYLQRQVGLSGIARFLSDRAKMKADATLTPPGRELSLQQVENFAVQLSVLLEGALFLGGPTASTPDLCCYHPLWMGASIDKRFYRRLPASVRDWMGRMVSIGHGTRTDATAAEVSAVIDAQAPLDIGSPDIPTPFELYQSVSVGPVDYARERSQGELISLTTTKIVLRYPSRTGHAVYLHFPTQGFAIEAV